MSDSDAVDRQPDFNALFFGLSRGRPTKLEYRTRPGPDYLHDVLFVSSLCHDARVLDVALNPSANGSVALTLQLSRDCWERGMCYVKGEGTVLHLQTAKSTLHISGVRDSDVLRKDIANLCGESIRYLWVGSGFRTRNDGDGRDYTIDLVVNSDSCVSLRSAESYMHLALADTQVPELTLSKCDSESGA